ncbi:MAG: hypothetical protein H6595_12815 [Flavobacteriales bacterium]|nr:hypothetical protein [Flavobacteriales bacterium]MCB9168345.1 hypothetical protein [Flavobacteriales bacterium]MCB9169037.1 hypothetical protein [Flavobacteriales bacterium]
MGRPERLERLKAEGAHIGVRRHGGFQVHLYRMEGYFVEMYLRIGLPYAEYIEVATNTDILSEYVKDLPDPL